MIRVKNVSQQRAQSCFHLASWYFWNVYPSLSGLLWDSQKELTDCFFFFFTPEEELLFLSAVSALSLNDTQSVQEKKKKTLSARSRTEKQKFGFFKRSATSNHGGQVTYHTEYED